MLSPEQADVLLFLKEHPLTPRQVGKVLKITANAAHHRLRRLEDKNYVRRIEYGYTDKWEVTALGKQALRNSRVTSLSQ